MKPIIQDSLPFKPWMEMRTRRLPGIQPLPTNEWLFRDDVFNDQMRYRDTLLSEHRSRVSKSNNGSLAAQTELLTLVLNELDNSYNVGVDQVVRPDNVTIALSGEEPIVTAGKLVQEDLLILEDGILTAAVLCFPASWTLSEKIGRNMNAIHNVVDEYDEDIEKRVQRLFDAIRPEQPLWRANFNIYENPELFQPRKENDKRIPPQNPEYVRVERQTLRKLPETGAVVFGIHTFVYPIEKLSQIERAELMKYASSAA